MGLGFMFDKDLRKLEMLVIRQGKETFPIDTIDTNIYHIPVISVTQGLKA